MADDEQQDATPSPDVQPDQDRSETEHPRAAASKADQPESAKAEQAKEDDEPADFLDARNVQRITKIWYQYNIGVQQTGPVHGGHASGAVTATVGTEGWSADGDDSRIRVKVKTAELERIRAVHVPSDPAHEKARVALREHGLVILHGRARWGKTTTALRLLDEQHPDEVYVLDRKSPFPMLNGTILEAERSYFIECLGAEAASGISIEALMHLSHKLVDLNSHLVVTIDGLVPVRTHALRWCLVACDELADPETVLERSLTWRLRDADCGIEKLMQPEWVGTELARRPHPARLDALASVLERVARKDLEAEQGLDAYRSLLAGQVAEWFETHTGLRERCLMVSIAVLNEASYQEIADAAGRLYKLLERPKTADRLHKLLELGKEEDEEGDRPPGPGWERASSRRRRVQDCCADLVCELEPTTIGDLPVELVRLEDPNLQPAVLQHVWTEHDGVRSKLLAWFEELGADRTAEVRGRAAAAVGSLAQRDFRYFQERLIRRWAWHDNRWVRWSAAVALDVLAAADEECEQRVRRLLRDWIRLRAESPLGWTAVAAYGFTMGRRAPKAALDDLLKVVQRNPRALWVAGRTIASLCDYGDSDLSRLMLEKLTYWSEQHRIPLLPDRALTVFLHAAGEVAIGQRELPRSGPVLLWVAAEEVDLRPTIATLWERALTHDELEDRSAGTLRRWLGQTGEQPQLQPALDDLFAALQRPGRSQAITRRLLTKWANDPLRPSAAAARYLRSVPWR